MVVEDNILKTFEAKKHLTASEYAKIAQVAVNTAKRYLNNLVNKGELRKYDDIFYSTSTNLQEVLLNRGIKVEKVVKEQHNKGSQKKSNLFFDTLIKSLNKQVTVTYSYGSEVKQTSGLLLAFEQNHLSLLLDDVEKNRYLFIRGNAIISLSVMKARDGDVNGR